MTRLYPRQLFNRVAGILTVIFVVAAGNAFAVWNWQNPLPQGNQLNDVAFIDGNTGYVVGVAGLVMRTTDRGTSWTTLTAVTTVNLNRIIFATMDSAWIFGDGGLVLWSKNGGQTWSKQTSGTTNNLYDAQFLDHSNAYAVGAGGTILRTVNAGVTWTKLVSGTTATLRGLSFVDVQHGWVVGFAGTILNTIDNGDSWTSHTGVSSSVNLFTCWFLSTNTGWVGGDYGSIWHTRNTGATWLNDVTASPERVNRFVALPNGVLAGASNAGNYVYAAMNDSIWYVLVSNRTNANFLGIHVVSDTGNIYFRTHLVGDKGVIFESNPNIEGGSLWNSLAPGTRSNLYAVYFTGTTAGYAVGDSGLLFRTNDGTHWWAKTVYPGGLFRGIAFNPRNQASGIMVGLSGLVFWTTDAGDSWTQDLSTVLMTKDLFGVSYSSDGTCYIVGGGGSVMRYSNNRWTALVTPTTRNLYSIYMADNTYGYITGQNGAFYKTTDAGSTWQPQNVFTTQDLYSVQVFHGLTSWNGTDSVEASNGFVVGNTGVVRRTTNGGKTWLAVNMGQGSGGAFRGIRFRNQFEGVIVGPGGAIYSTTNGGTSWTNQSSPTKSNLMAVWVANQNDGYTVGENGTVLYNASIGLPVEIASFAGWQEGSGAKLAWTTASEQNNARFEIERHTVTTSWTTVGAVVGNGTSSDRHAYSFVDSKLAPNTYTYRLKQMDNDGSFHFAPTEVEVTVGAPSTMALFQNYPNPFNPTTNISYDLKTAGNVTLEIFNVVGERVALLKNTVEDAGHHVVTFDASNLSSGSYEYRLNVDGNIITRHMALLK